jgi:hypothetical protein
VTDHIVALDLLISLYSDREVCVTVGDVGRFSSSDSRLLLFFCRHQVFGLWVHWFGFSRVEMPGAMACGWLVGQGFTVSEGGADY